VTLYFYAFLIICSFFSVNLFVGVVIDNFRMSSGSGACRRSSLSCQLHRVRCAGL
jgi:hypothetical protein